MGPRDSPCSEPLSTRKLAPSGKKVVARSDCSQEMQGEAALKCVAMDFRIPNAHPLDAVEEVLHIQIGNDNGVDEAPLRGRFDRGPPMRQGFSTTRQGYAPTGAYSRASGRAQTCFSGEDAWLELPARLRQP